MKTLLLRRSIPVITALLTGLGGGWHLKRPGGAAPVTLDGTALPPTHQAPASRGGDPLRRAWATASDGETMNASMPAPFTSLDELAEIIAGFDLFDEASGVELMTGLPRLFTTDLPAVRRLLDELGHAPSIPKNAREMIAMTLMTRWLMQEPESAVRYALCHASLFDADSGGEFASFGLAMLSKRDPAMARAMLSILPEDERTEAEELLTMCEALDDPETYLTTKSLEGVDNADELAGAWARRDPQAAAQWVLSLPGTVEEDETDNIIAAVAAGWAHKDRNGALAWVASLPSGNAKSEAYRHIAEIITEGMTCAQGAAALTSMPPEIADRVLLSLAGNEQPEEFADSIAAILTRHVGEDDFQQDASSGVSHIARSLAMNGDGAGAAAWVARLPDGAARTSAAAAVANEWAGKDAVAASEWISNLPPGEMRSRAAVGLIEKIAGDDPERALVWATSIPAEELRNEQVGKVLRDWLPKDPYAAMTAVEALPEGIRSAIWTSEE